MLGTLLLILVLWTSGCLCDAVACIWKPQRSSFMGGNLNLVPLGFSPPMHRKASVKFFSNLDFFFQVIHYILPVIFTVMYWCGREKKPAHLRCPGNWLSAPGDFYSPNDYMPSSTTIAPEQNFLSHLKVQRLSWLSCRRTTRHTRLCVRTLVASLYHNACEDCKQSFQKISVLRNVVKVPDGNNGPPHAPSSRPIWWYRILLRRPRISLPQSTTYISW
jgi:hypothetical protein